MAVSYTHRDKQIRCTLTSFDLSVRNINLVELAYGTEKARKLFREMIQKASNEVGFEAEDIPLMVEAIPVSYTHLDVYKRQRIYLGHLLFLCL